MQTEVCDEGPDSIGDDIGCNDDCGGTEYGWECIGGDTESPSTCYEVCGNMMISTNEDCEDRNTLDGDGCDSECKFEIGWTHSHSSDNDGDLTTSIPDCGDGLAVGDEL